MPNSADSDRSDESETIAIGAESVDVGVPLGPANLPGPLYEPAPRGPACEVDWVRLDALVRAVEALVGANMASEARPLVSRLRAIVAAARGPHAEVIELASARVERR